MQVEIPLLQYFQNGNEYSAAIEGMRYLLSPISELVLDQAGNPILNEKGKEKTVRKLSVTIWPDPWALNRTDPALRSTTLYLLDEAGRVEAMEWLAERYQAELARWQDCPGILDCTPWMPVPEEKEASEGNL